MEKPIGIILAAGRGTRMRELTDSTPKPLLYVRGETLLVHVLKGLAPQVSEIVIVVGYLEGLIKTAIGDSYAGVPIVYATQSNPQGGTLDALRAGFSVVQDQTNTQGVIVVSADDIHNAHAFEQLYLAAQAHPERMILVGIRLDDTEELKRFGVFVFSADGKITGIEEKPAVAPSPFINCALYYFPPAFKKFVFSDIPAKPNGELYLTDPIDIWIQAYGADFLEVHEWEVIGTPEDLELANQKVVNTRLT